MAEKWTKAKKLLLTAAAATLVAFDRAAEAGGFAV